MTKRKSPPTPVKAPSPVDVAIGQRIRARRMILGMSQEKLGDALGLTFQQVQKYEKGANRVGGSRMHQIATILQVPVSFLHGENGSGKLDPTITELAGAIRDAATLRLLKAAAKLSNSRDRCMLADLAERMVDLNDD